MTSQTQHRALPAMILLLLLAVSSALAQVPSDWSLSQAIEEALLGGQWQTAFDLIVADTTSVLNPVARMASAHCALALHDYRSARILFDSMAGQEDLDAWKAWTDSLFSRQSDDGIARYLHADAVMRSAPFAADGDLVMAQSIELYDDAIAADSTVPLFWNGRAVAKIHARQFTSAIADCERAVALDSSFVEARFNQAVSLERQGKLYEAINIHSGLIDRHPDFVKAIGFRAGLLRETGQFDKALADCDRALELDSLYLVIHFVKARIYEDAGRIDDAIAAYRTFLERPTQRWSRQGRIATLKLKELTGKK